MKSVAMVLPEGSDIFYLRCWVCLVGAVALFNGFHCYMHPEYTNSLQPKEGGCGSLCNTVPACGWSGVVNAGVINAAEFFHCCLSRKSMCARFLVHTN